MKPQETLKNPPLNFYPLIFWSDESDWMRIHRFHAQQTWQRAKGISAKIKLLAQAMLWPLFAIRSISVKTRKFGKTIEKQTGKSKGRQRYEQFLLAIFQGISPKSYYLFQLYLPENRLSAQRFLHRYETKGEVVLYRILSPGSRAGSKILNRKDEFYRHCVKNNIATAPVYMTIEAEPRESGDKEVLLPKSNLFIKPALGRGGKGTQIWFYRGTNSYESPEGEALKGSELLERLRRDAAGGPLLVQLLLENHPQLSDLCGRVFSTARMMTVLDENLEPEVTTAVFRMANGSAVVDNIHRGGLAAGVDLATGTLGSAQSLSPTAMRVERHPKSQMTISKRSLPQWAEAKDMVVRAHKTIAGKVVIGWDVGFAKDGPLLVEGNSAPCVHLLQRGLGAPLGGTRFAELIAFHLGRVQSVGQPDDKKAA